MLTYELSLENSNFHSRRKNVMYIHMYVSIYICINGIMKEHGITEVLDSTSSACFLRTCVIGITYIYSIYTWEFKNVDASNQPCYLFAAAYKRMDFIFRVRGNWLTGTVFFWTFFFFFCLRIGIQAFLYFRSLESDSIWVIQCCCIPLHTIVKGGSQVENIGSFTQ